MATKLMIALGVILLAGIAHFGYQQYLCNYYDVVVQNDSSGVASRTSATAGGTSGSSIFVGDGGQGGAGTEVIEYCDLSCRMKRLENRRRAYIKYQQKHNYAVKNYKNRR